MSATPAGGVLAHVAAFGHALRDAGLEVGPRRLETAARGLEAMGLGSRDTVYWTLSAALVSRREDAAVFDAGFRAFWDGIAPPPRGEDPDAAPPVPEHAGDGGDPADAPALSGPAGDDDGEGDEGEQDIGLAFSAHERLRHVDFADYDAADLEAARRLMRRIRAAAPRRRSRRRRAAASGRELDPRRTLRSAMRTEGHPLQRAWRAQRIVDRRLIFLIDVSGSMEPYARPVVVFAQLVGETARRVDVYTFGTRLTRITGELSGRSAARALERAGRAIPDWAGGTRIGESVKALNDTAGRRGLTRGAVVVVVSDGCERDAPELLAAELARLRRAAHAIVWVNPLAGDARYEPRTQGMVAALPHVDALLAGHNIAALESLAAALEAIPERRAARPAARAGR